MLNTSVMTRLTPEAEAVITRSVTEALQLGYTDVRVEHLLLAILRETRGPAATALARYPSLRDEIIRVLATETLAQKITKMTQESSSRHFSRGSPGEN